MKTDEKYKALRELIIEEIGKSIYSGKPSPTKLKKEDDMGLITYFKQCFIFAERQLWQEDVLEALHKLNPKGKFSKTTSKGMLNTLIEVAKEIKK